MITGANLTQFSPYSNSFCSEATPYYDIDGDTEVRCDYSGNCPYQRTVKDCDGDTVVMCNKY